MSNDLKEWEKRCRDNGARLAEVAKRHPWIGEVRESLGRAGSEFDFSGKDMPALKQRRTGLRSDQVGEIPHA